VLYTIVVLLVFFGVIALALAGLQWGLAESARVAPWTLVPIGLLALYLRYLKSKQLGEKLDEEERRQSARVATEDLRRKC